jgi:hypothetical protein
VEAKRRMDMNINGGLFGGTEPNGEKKGWWE